VGAVGQAVVIAELLSRHLPLSSVIGGSLPKALQVTGGQQLEKLESAAQWYASVSHLASPLPAATEVTEGIPSGWKPPGAVWRVVVVPQRDEGDEEVEIPGGSARICTRCSAYGAM
jgi:hypothetical protein